jgi:hypothetical protein
VTACQIKVAAAQLRIDMLKAKMQSSQVINERQRIVDRIEGMADELDALLVDTYIRR